MPSRRVQGELGTNDYGYLRGGLTSLTAFEADDGETHAGTLLVFAVADAAPRMNAPDAGVTTALHGCTEVVQLTPRLPLPRTTIVALPTFCCCSSATTTPNWSPVREHRTVPVTVAAPFAPPANEFASMVSVTTVKSVKLERADIAARAARHVPLVVRQAAVHTECG